VGVLPLFGLSASGQQLQRDARADSVHYSLPLHRAHIQTLWQLDPVDGDDIVNIHRLWVNKAKRQENTVDDGATAMEVAKPDAVTRERLLANLVSQARIVIDEIRRGDFEDSDDLPRLRSLSGIVYTLLTTADRHGHAPALDELGQLKNALKRIRHGDTVAGLNLRKESCGTWGASDSMTDAHTHAGCAMLYGDGQFLEQLDKDSRDGRYSASLHHHHLALLRRHNPLESDFQVARAHKRWVEKAAASDGIDTAAKAVVDYYPTPDAAAARAALPNLLEVGKFGIEVVGEGKYERDTMWRLRGHTGIAFRALSIAERLGSAEASALLSDLRDTAKSAGSGEDAAHSVKLEACGTWNPPKGESDVDTHLGCLFVYGVGQGLQQLDRDIGKDATLYSIDLHHAHLDTLWRNDPYDAESDVALAHAKWVNLAAKESDEAKAAAEKVLAAHPKPSAVTAKQHLEALVELGARYIDIVDKFEYDTGAAWRLRGHAGVGFTVLSTAARHGHPEAPALLDKLWAVASRRKFAGGALDPHLMENSTGTWATPEYVQDAQSHSGNPMVYGPMEGVEQIDRDVRDTKTYFPGLHFAHLYTLWRLDPLNGAVAVERAHKRWVAVAAKEGPQQKAVADRVLTSCPQPTPEVATLYLTANKELARWHVKVVETFQYNSQNSWRLLGHVNNGMGILNVLDESGFADANTAAIRADLAAAHKRHADNPGVKKESAEASSGMYPPPSGTADLAIMFTRFNAHGIFYKLFNVDNAVRGIDWYVPAVHRAHIEVCWQVDPVGGGAAAAAAHRRWVDIAKKYGAAESAEKVLSEFPPPDAAKRKEYCEGLVAALQLALERVKVAEIYGKDNRLRNFAQTAVARMALENLKRAGHPTEELEKNFHDTLALMRERNADYRKDLQLLPFVKVLRGFHRLGGLDQFPDWILPLVDESVRKAAEDPTPLADSVYLEALHRRHIEVAWTLTPGDDAAKQAALERVHGWHVALAEREGCEVLTQNAKAVINGFARQ